MTNLSFLCSYSSHIRQNAFTLLLCTHRKAKGITNMRTAAKILLAPIWIVAAILRLACRLVAGIGIYVLTIGGGLLLVYDLLLVIIRMSSKELWLQLLAVAGAMLVIPFIAGFLEGLLENAADAIKEFIES